MTGSLLVVSSKKAPERFLRVRFRLKSGHDLRFEDMRVLGRLWYVPAGKQFEDVIPSLKEMGVEPLEGLDRKHLAGVLKGKKQPIKSALLDQRVLAGIGNIYADEALFRAKIHPLRGAGSLKENELEVLSKAIRDILESAIAFRGTTLRDYKDTEGRSGGYQNQSLVYGRFGKACRVCSTEIERTKIGGRSSHFCPDCQPRQTKGSAKKSAAR
jgi:formamidopyrimidine-DNA glycosylase